MLTVGDRVPEFRLTALTSLEPGREWSEIDSASFAGRWLVLFFWPMDFTFVCPTEVAEFSRRLPEFRERGANLLGASVDSHYVHLAWRQSHPLLREGAVAMLSDTKRELSSALGILHAADGMPHRATFIADPEGVIRHVSVNDRNAGRSVEETLRVLAALQSDELTPCEWTVGAKTLGKG